MRGHFTRPMLPGAEPPAMRQAMLPSPPARIERRIERHYPLNYPLNYTPLYQPQAAEAATELGLVDDNDAQRHWAPVLYLAGVAAAAIAAVVLVFAR